MAWFFMQGRIMEPQQRICDVFVHLACAAVTFDLRHFSRQRSAVQQAASLLTPCATPSSAGASL
jgi:hypothetical protein